MRGGRYQSPMVKQDLAKLDKSPDVRRSALLSLRACVEQLDQVSMPRFLAQVSDARDLNDSRSYAISLYEDVARVHGKLIAPHIPRIMATVVRSLSSSGSSVHLQEACSRVAASILRYSVCPDTPASQVLAVFQDLCAPLLDSLLSKLEPLAAGAALCLQTLVESEKWKYAPQSLVAELRAKSTLALKERAGQTVAHMQLARSLIRTDTARAEPELVRAAKELLQVAPSWQHKSCALQLLRASMAGLDREILGAEMAPLEHLIEQLRLDRMPHVRKEAVKTAQALRLVASEESSKATLHADGASSQGTPGSRRRFYCADASASSDSDASYAAKAEEEEEEEERTWSGAVNRYRGHDHNLALITSAMPKQDTYSPDSESPTPSSSGQTEAVLTAEDFARFTTPRRLVRSLQLQVASPDRSDPCCDEEARSETGWSVRDNPIAEGQGSDESNSSAVVLEEECKAGESWKGRACKAIEGMLGACACLALLLPLATVVMQLLLRRGGGDRDLHVCLVPT